MISNYRQEWVPVRNGLCAVTLMILPWGSLLSPGPVTLLLPDYICVLPLPCKKIWLSEAWEVGNSFLPYTCKSMGCPGKGRHRDLRLCKWCYRAWWCDQGSCAPHMTSLLKAVILVCSGVTQCMPQTLLGNLTISYTIAFLIPCPH